MKYSRVERYKELRDQISEMDSYSFDETSVEEKQGEESVSYEESSLNGELAESVESLLRTKESAQNKRMRKEMKKKYKAQKKSSRKTDGSSEALRTGIIIGIVAVIVIIVVLVVYMVVSR